MPGSAYKSANAAQVIPGVEPGFRYTEGTQYCTYNPDRGSSSGRCETSQPVAQASARREARLVPTSVGFGVTLESLLLRASGARSGIRRVSRSRLAVIGSARVARAVQYFVDLIEVVGNTLRLSHSGCRARVRDVRAALLGIFRMTIIGDNFIPKKKNHW